MQRCTWRDSAAVVQQGLTEVSKNWEKLELAGTCPYLPTAKGLAGHKKHYKDYENVQRLKLWLLLVRYTNSDGWVPTDD